MKRLHDIDIAKGIGIFLVVFGHTCRNAEVQSYIYFFHMPLFFIVSGFFFNPKKYTSYFSFLKETSKTLLLPYITFYILSYLYWLFIERAMRPGSETISPITPIYGFFYGTDYKDFMKPNGALWFLWGLFIARNFLFFATRAVKDKISLLTIFVAGAAIGWALSVTNFIKLPFSINSSFFAFFFVGIGYLSKPVYLQIKALSVIKQSIVAIFALVISILAIRYNQVPDMDYCKYGNVFLFVGGALAGTTLCLLFSNVIAPNFILEFLGKNSLIIMGLSEPIKRAVIGLFNKFSHIEVDVIRDSVGLSLACAGITIIILVPAIFIFNKYLYFTIGLDKKVK